MKASRRHPTKRAATTAACKLPEPVRPGKAVLAMPTTPAVEANDQAARIDAHRRQLDAINEAYRLTMQNVFNVPLSLAQKRALIRKNVRQFAAALAEWQIAALHLLAAGQQAALVQMWPDFKGGRGIH